MSTEKTSSAAEAATEIVTEETLTEVSAAPEEASAAGPPDAPPAGTSGLAEPVALAETDALAETIEPGADSEPAAAEAPTTGEATSDAAGTSGDRPTSGGSQDGQASDPAGEPEPTSVDADAGNAEPAEPPMETGAMPEGSVQEAMSGDEHNERELKSLVEAVVYITDEPLSAQQIATAMDRPLELVQKVLDQLVEEYAQDDRGLTVRELAGGYKMGTKPEHHEALKAFVKGLKPALKLSLAALETLAVIAYKQPITGPEIMEIRGVQGAGVLKTLLDRKLIANAGRKAVVGKPMLYKTTKEFLLQFGLNSLNELPTLKEFEELRRMALSDDDDVLGGNAPAAPAEEREADISAMSAPALPPATPEQAQAEADQAVAATKDGVPDEATQAPTDEPENVGPDHG